MKLDQTVVDRILGDFAVLIKGTAESTERGRFHVIMELARQAQSFQRFNGTRVEDFDKDPATYDLNGGPGYIGNAVVQGGFGDQAEMIRTLIDSIKDINAKRQSPAAQLKELLDVRAELKRQSTESTDDIDQQIDRLRKEIVNGTIAAVVHPELLRGPPPGENEPGHDEAVVGEGHADGAPGAGVPVRARGEEGLG